MNLTTARVAELVDAADSKSAVRKDVLVRFQSRARVKFINPCYSKKYKGFLFLGDTFGDRTSIFFSFQITYKN